MFEDEDNKDGDMILVIILNQLYDTAMVHSPGLDQEPDVLLLPRI